MASLEGVSFDTSGFVCHALLTVLVVWGRCVSVAEGRALPSAMSIRVVETQYGRLRGVLFPSPDPRLPQVEAYLGLQYASLLAGQLRFMPPTTPMEKWEGIRVAQRFRPVCPQRLPDLKELERRSPATEVERWRILLPFLENQQEDCLSLNIYVPARDGEATSVALPVLLFVQSETYETGSGNAYDGSVLASFGHVVVVTVNYRLGALGFLSTGDNNAHGNYGLLDLVAALQYIRENIAAFGGDPNEVTLMGHGYGAAMVNLLLISPVTKGKGLFKRAILLTGSALTTWAIVTDPLRYTLKLSQRFNCSHWAPDLARLVSCLKTVPSEDIAAADIKAPKYLSAFGPVVDRRSILPTDVSYTMEKATTAAPSFPQTGLLLGVSSEVGYAFFTRNETDGLPGEWLRQVFLRTLVQNVYHFHRQKIFDILAYHYRDWERPRDPVVLRDNLLGLVSDGIFVAPCVQVIRLHSSLPNAAPAFLFSFSSPARHDMQAPWAAGGWTHASQLAFALGAPILVGGINPFPSTYTRQEKTVSETMLRYLTNFIKYGNPNGSGKTFNPLPGPPPSSFPQTNWPSYDLQKQQYLIMSIDSKPEASHHYRGSKMALWLDLIPQIHHSDNLSQQFHLLDSYDNLTSYDADGLDWETLDLLVSTFSKSHSSTELTFPASSTTTSSSVGVPATVIPSLASTFRRPLPPTTHRHRTSPRQRTTPGPAGARREVGTLEGRSGRESSVPLSVTIAVGCGLLFLNILVFAAIFYQRGKTRRCDFQKNRQQQQFTVRSHDEACSDTFKSSPARESSPAHDSSPAHETDSNCSLSSTFSTKTQSQDLTRNAVYPHHQQQHRHFHHHHHHHHHQLPAQTGNDSCSSKRSSVVVSKIPPPALTSKEVTYATVASRRCIGKQLATKERYGEESLLNEYTRIEPLTDQMNNFHDNPSTTV